MNEGVNICCKAIKTKFLIVESLFDETSTYIVKPKGYIDTCPYISSPSITVTSSGTFLPPSLLSSIFSEI